MNKIFHYRKGLIYFKEIFLSTEKLKNIQNPHYTIIKNNKGGVLLYVIIIISIITTLFFLSLTLFSSSAKRNKSIQTFIQKNIQQDNIINNIEARYKNNPFDIAIPLKQKEFQHQVTQYSNNYTQFLHANIDTEKSFSMNIHQSQKEAPFLNTDTGLISDNQLEKIRGFQIYWNMKNTIDNDELKQFNSIGRTENSHLRITLTKTGPQNSTRCFNTNNLDVINDIIIDGGDSLSSVFNNELIIKESFFKSATLSNDCTKTPDYIGDPDATPPINPDPFEPKLLNNDSVLPLDFSNFHYTLTIEILNGDSHVRVKALGNNGFLPTKALKIIVEPEFSGNTKSKTIEL